MSYESMQGSKMLRASKAYHSKLANGSSIYVLIDEDANGNPSAIFINEGKAGSRERSYTDCIARLVTRLLTAGVELKEIVLIMDGITCSTNDSMPCAIADIFRKHLGEVHQNVS